MSRDQSSPDDPALLEERLGYFFARPELLEEALRHRSYVFERTAPELRDNERLEFLGDAVLELAVSAMLHLKRPEDDEGRLTRLRAQLVNEQSLCRLASQLDLGRFLYLGRGEALSGGAGKSSILAGGLEAVLGAVYLDGGFEAALGLVRRFWEPLLGELGEEQAFKDYKTRFQELIQERLKLTPSYRLLSSQGPDHDRTFLVEVRAGGQALGQGQGKSKKEAEQEAARAALIAMEKEL